MYVLIIMRGLVVAMNARTSFHSLTAFGIVAMLGLQTMLIVGGNTKLIPLTGVTLPLVSSGGSSLVSTFLSFGILLGISSMNAEDEARDIDRLELREERHCERTARQDAPRRRAHRLPLHRTGRLVWLYGLLAGQRLGLEPYNTRANGTTAHMGDITDRDGNCWPIPLRTARAST